MENDKKTEECQQSRLCHLNLPFSIFVVSSNNHSTERISQFVDYYLKPLVCTVPSYIKDTTDFLNKLTNLNTINTLPDNAILVSLDVTSLYTDIPQSEGIEACRFFLRKRNDKHIPTETLCDLIQIILNMNNFTFNNKHYLQKHGTALGTKMAPSVHLPIFFLPNSNVTHSLTHLIYLIHGSDF